MKNYFTDVMYCTDLLFDQVRQSPHSRPFPGLERLIENWWNCMTD
jgi:hypothetical protein